MPLALLADLSVMFFELTERWTRWTTFRPVFWMAWLLMVWNNEKVNLQSITLIYSGGGWRLNFFVFWHTCRGDRWLMDREGNEGDSAGAICRKYFHARVEQWFPFKSLARNPSIPKSMFHSWCFFFLDDHRSHPFAAKPTRWCQFLQPLWQESKRTWKRWSYFDWIWHDALVEYPGGPRGWISFGLPEAMIWLLWRSASCTGCTFSWHVYRIPLQPEFRNMKTKTSYFGTTISFKITMALCQFRSSKKSPHFFGGGAKQVRKPESLVARAGSSCHLQLVFFGRGPPPEKEKEKHRSAKHQLRDDDICNVGKNPSICTRPAQQIVEIVLKSQVAGRAIWISGGISHDFLHDGQNFSTCLHSSSLPISNLKSSFALQLQFNFKHVFQSKAIQFAPVTPSFLEANWWGTSFGSCGPIEARWFVPWKQRFGKAKMGETLRGSQYAGGSPHATCLEAWITSGLSCPIWRKDLRKLQWQGVSKEMRFPCIFCLYILDLGKWEVFGRANESRRRTRSSLS